MWYGDFAQVNDAGVQTPRRSLTLGAEATDMDTRTMAVDLAKNVFEVAVADERWRIVERRRLSRLQFQRYVAGSSATHVVMEACASAHYWARTLQERGVRVSLLPA
jgi:uncharacterized tellurite resistance protein B-like protein